MVKCKACGLEHPSGMRCERAKRLLGVKANGETPLDQPVIKVATEIAGVDRLERQPSILVLCPVCEARKANDRERVKRWRAKR